MPDRTAFIMARGQLPWRQVCFKWKKAASSFTAGPIDAGQPWKMERGRSLPCCTFAWIGWLSMV